MELHTQSAPILNTITGGQRFGVEMGPQLFAVLTSSLYKDKPRAVVRETLANAVDAHRQRDALFGGATPEALAADPSNSVLRAQFNDLLERRYAVPGTKPKLHLPSRMEPWFSVEDFGLGLTPEQIMGELKTNEDGSTYREGGIYTTLFASDKRENNQAIGAYGLGSKSPFSISDVFTVHSFVGGVEHRYMMYLGVDGSPLVNWLTEDSPIQTERPNGVIVRIDNIPMNISAQLVDSVRYMMLTLDEHERPIVDGDFSIPQPLEFEFITPQIGKTKHNLLNSSVYVSTGGVLYPVETAKIKETLSPAECGVFESYISDSTSLVAFMPLGSIAIPPSREEISYDEVSMENVTEVLRVAIQKSVEEAKKILEETSVGAIHILGAVNKVKLLLGDSMAANLISHWKMERTEKLSAIGLTMRGFEAFLKIGSKLKLRETMFVWLRDGYRGLQPINRDSWILDKAFDRHTGDMSMTFFRKDSLIVLNDAGVSTTSILTKVKTVYGSDVAKLLVFTKDKRLETDPKDTIYLINSLEELESEIQPICLNLGVDYVLSSDIIEKFNEQKKPRTVISTTEIERNMSCCDGSSVYAYSVEDFDNEENTYGWMSEDDWNLVKNKFFIDTCSGSDAREILHNTLNRFEIKQLFSIKGVRTVSRKRAEQSENFIRIDPEEFCEEYQKLYDSYWTEKLYDKTANYRKVFPEDTFSDIMSLCLVYKLMRRTSNIRDIFIEFNTYSKKEQKRLIDRMKTFGVDVPHVMCLVSKTITKIFNHEYRHSKRFFDFGRKEVFYKKNIRKVRRQFKSPLIHDVEELMELMLKHRVFPNLYDVEQFQRVCLCLSASYTGEFSFLETYPTEEDFDIAARRICLSVVEDQFVKDHSMDLSESDLSNINFVAQALKKSHPCYDKMKITIGWEDPLRVFGATLKDFGINFNTSKEYNEFASKFHY